MPTKRSVSPSSRPRPNCIAYFIASSRLSSPARIDSRSTSERSCSFSSPRSRRATLMPSGSGRPVSSSHHSPRSTDFSGPTDAAVKQPPFAEVDRLLEAERRVRQLALVNQQPGVRTPLEHLVEDLVEEKDS